MCYPMIAMAVGGVMSAVGAIQGGKAQEQYANAQADMLRQQGVDAKERADIEADKARRKGKQMGGQQMAQMVANGVAITADGTVGDLLQDTAMFAELDAMTALNNGERQAYYKEYSALNEIARGKNANRAGKISAVGTLLGTAGSLGGMMGSQNLALKEAGKEAMSFGDFMTQGFGGVA